jgi:hypothetical protein
MDSISEKNHCQIIRTLQTATIFFPLKVSISMNLRKSCNLHLMLLPGKVLKSHNSENSHNHVLIMEFMIVSLSLSGQHRNKTLTVCKLQMHLTSSEAALPELQAQDVHGSKVSPLGAQPLTLVHHTSPKNPTLQGTRQGTPKHPTSKATN